MKKLILALVLSSATATAFVAPPAAAQSSSYAEQRWQQAQERYRAETDIYNRERDRYMAARGRGYNSGGYNDGRYNAPPPPPPGYGNRGYDDRDPYVTDYDASRYYRQDTRYQERRLSNEDMVYRGSDGRYYCKRNDGSVGLIVGGVGGALLGNVIDGGRHRTGGTLIGGALGALAGTAISQQNADVRCR
jgi:hypothetical protein